MVMDNPERRYRQSYGARLEHELKAPRRSFARIVGTVCWVLLGIAALAFVFWILAMVAVPGALSHEAMSGWSYPNACCGDSDCWQLPESAVKETAAGFTIIGSGEFVPRSEANVSGDEFFHLCRFPGPKIICFFYPPRGF